MRSSVSTVLLFSLCWMTVFSDGQSSDYYETLGVSRTASAKEIRIAFKKLVVRMHPDKNKGDDKAHEKFLKITRAYEVLKDEELRRKYDVLGEAGLKDEDAGDGQYESWQYYREEFGIYDEDKEIVTLTYSDFETSVENSNDVWFINFYSPRCSHCHVLAPTWREVARDLEGVIRVGSVNCYDEHNLCTNEHIRSYPSLVLYPQHIRYRDERTREKLVDFVLQHTQSAPTILTPANFGELSQPPDRPWLISICGRKQDCLLPVTARKLSVMLAGLVNVATLDCHWQTALCSQLAGARQGGTFFAATGLAQLQSASSLFTIDSLYTQDVGRAVLARLPAMKELSPERLHALQEELREGRGAPYLVRFYTDTSEDDIELRKLPVILAQSDVKTGQLDCRKYRNTCHDFFLLNFPKFALFKPSGYEFHYGRTSSHDLTNFARSSVKNPLLSLDPVVFRRSIGQQDHVWFVDFFAPWCPPCMRLLPKFKAAAAENDNPQIRFGTVDCTVHRQLCQEHEVTGYPSTLLFNGTEPHNYDGPASLHHYQEFVDDILHPKVVQLDPHSFPEAVTDGKWWLVDFFAPWCSPCQALAPEWRQVAKMFADKDSVIRVGSVNCQQFKDLCRSRHVRGYPTIRLYRSGSKYWEYSSYHRDADSIYRWALDYLPSKVRRVRGRFFDRNVLASSQPWLIDFYAPWCGACQVFAPKFVEMADVLTNVRLGKVNCDEDEVLCERAKIQRFPTVVFYSSKRTDAAGHHIDSLEPDEIAEKVRELMGSEHDEL